MPQGSDGRLRQRSILFLAALCAVFLAAVGCAAPAKDGVQVMAGDPTGAAAISSTTTTAPKPVVALVMKTLTNPFFISMEKGARRAAQELGVVLVVKTASQETSIEQQMQIVRDMTAQHVSAIVIAPGDSTELVLPLREAQQAGVVVVNIDNPLDPAASAKAGLTGVPLITVDNEFGAYLAASYLSARITVPTQAAVLEGIPEAANSSLRKQGALRAFAENPNITVVAVQTAHWKIDEAHDVAATLFEAHPNIGAVYCANDMMALGVLQFLKETGRSTVLVAAYDALDEAKTMIAEGRLLASVDQQADEQGYQGVVCAVRMLKGESVPATTVVDVRLVTAESLK